MIASARWARPLVVALVASGLTALGTAYPSPATAVDTEAANPTPIVITEDVTEAAPYPSSITISGAATHTLDVDVTLHGLAHTFPDDISVAVVGPQGQAVLLMSAVGGATDVSDVDLSFDDEATSAIPGGQALATGAFQPTSEQTVAFPAPGPGTTYCNPSVTPDCLATFDGTDPNGTWNLYVIDNFGSDPGEFAGGWSLTVEANSPPTIAEFDVPYRTKDSTPTFTFSFDGDPTSQECRVIPEGQPEPLFQPCTSPFDVASELADGRHVFEVQATNAAGTTPVLGEFVVDSQAVANFTRIAVPADGDIADPYPSTIEVQGRTDRAITDLNVSLWGITHAVPGDLDIALVGPSGQAVLLLSDLEFDSNDSFSLVDLTLDDQGETFPNVGPPGPGPYQPRNVGNGDQIPAPGPEFDYCNPAATLNCLAEFDGTSPNGTWSLYVVDDFTQADGGSFAGGWSLVMSTDDVATTVVIDSGPAAGNTDRTPTFQFSVDEEATFACRIFAQGATPGPFGECAGEPGSHTVAANLAYGDYTFEVQATDLAGNVDTAALGFVVVRTSACTAAEADQAQAQAELASAKKALKRAKKALNRARAQLKKAKASGTKAQITKAQRRVAKAQQNLKRLKRKVRAKTAALEAANAAVAANC
jgi:subtilisin-like proprotein convertase family protein